MNTRRLSALSMLCMFTISTSMTAAEPVSLDKGNFLYSNPPAQPHIDLDLEPIREQVSKQAATRCGTPLAAHPLDLGEAESFMGKMMGKAAGAAVGKLLGGLLGSGGGSRKKPKLAKDPIKNKFKNKLSHPTGDARIRVGGVLADDGLIISAKIDKASGKGTFHTMFLERPDCSRIWPEHYQQYGLWGSWSLSVSVTETRSTYRNGQLVDRSVARSGWSKSGNFDFSRGFSLWDQLPGEGRRMVLNADEAYLTQLRREIDVPAWHQMGHAKPVQGVKSAGGLFLLDPAELTPGTIAVVHITHVDKGRYKTLGFPMSMQVVDGDKLDFQLASENF